MRVSAGASGSAVFAIIDAQENNLLGSLSIREINRLPDQATATYWVYPDARGRGAAGKAPTAAADWMLSPVRNGGLGLHRLVLDHAVLNTASCEVAARAGFARPPHARFYGCRVPIRAIRRGKQRSLGASAARWPEAHPHRVFAGQALAQGSSAG
ncbi:GNAT family N-acetyltransferase [Streptomyces scopuliridis]|uniref:GNAT family N-acetyltransferase n=1 Tax=Streptomyces scopuliridis TaxID=452529 RepID=UPI0036B60929